MEKIEKFAEKSHWHHSDTFGNGKNEYIKSFVHSDYSMDFHTHSFYELNIILSGSGSHYIEEMYCEAKEGFVFVIPPNVKHGYINNGGLDVYHLLIHREFLQKYFSDFKDTVGFSLLFEIEPYLRAQYSEKMFLKLSNAELQNVLSNITFIENCKEITESNTYINTFAKNILACLCLLITERNGIENQNFKTPDKLWQIADSLNYIHRNFEEKITVELLAKMQNMSRATYIRQFERVCGCSPHRYITDYRIKKAKEYLKNGNKSITEIAQICGFYDASHLRKLLKNNI